MSNNFTNINLQPVKSIRLYSKVVDQLKNLISKGEIKPGQRLPSERELASMFKIGRPSVREALRVLEAIGYIEVRLGLGVFIRENTNNLKDEEMDFIINSVLKEETRTKNLYEARALIEPNLAGLASERITESEITKFQDYFKDIKEKLDNNSICFEDDKKFHILLAEAAKNGFLRASLNFILESLNTELKQYFDIEGRKRQSYLEHLKIFKAIQKCNVGEANKLMEEHLISRFKKI